MHGHGYEFSCLLVYQSHVAARLTINIEAKSP